MDLTILFSTFGLLFVAELGDKTQLAIISQVCKYRRSWPVFLGGSLALATVTGIAVAFGHLLHTLIPQILIQRLAAAAFVVIGLFILITLWRERSRVEVCGECQPTDDAGQRRFEWIAFSSTFGLLFIAELGDKTQLAALSMASKSGSPWLVLAGAILALTMISGLAVLLGQGLCRLVPERALRLLSAGAFIAIGILIWFGVF